MVLDTQVCLPTRDGGGRNHPAEGIMLNLRGERMTTALGGTVGWLTPVKHKTKPEEDIS